MRGPLDHVAPQTGSPVGMDPFFLAGLGMLGQSGQPGGAGIGQGALQGLLAYSQMQQAELQNQAARQELAQTGRWADYVSGRPPEEQKLLTALGPEAGPAHLAKLEQEAAKRQGGAWQGTGMQAQWMNNYNRLMAKLRSGVPLTAEEQSNLSYSYQKLTAPQDVTDAAGNRYRIPGAQLTAPPGLVGGPSSLGPTTSTVPFETEKPPSQTELKNRSYFQRALAADTEMRRLEAEGFDPGGFSPEVIRDYIGMRMKESPQVLNQLFGSAITSPEAAVYASAVGDFIAGQLRYDSGAAVPETEFSRYYTIYVPMPNEGPMVSAAKARRRESATRALAGASGLSNEEYRKKVLRQMEKDAKEIPLPQEPQPAPAVPATPAAAIPAPATPAAGDLPVSSEGHIQVPF